MLKNNQYRFSLYTAWVIALIILVYHLLLPGYEEGYFVNELKWDVLSYYLYLPLTFIYGDPAIHNYSIIENIFQLYQPSGTFYQAFKLNDGYVINYTCGMAYLYAPFFFIGHLWALLGDYRTDGFTLPYQFSIYLGVYLYIIPGIFFLRKILIQFFNDKTTSLVMIFLLLGTNYFNEAVAGHLGPHAILFALLSAAVYYTIKWHQNPDLKNSILIGFLYGLSVLLRPSELLLMIFPVFYLVYNKTSFTDKLIFYKNNLRYILVSIITAFVLFIPQFIYWKVVTGKFLFYSYQNTEGFNFFEPHLLETLFSFKNSWFLYTPIIIFPLLGFISMYRRNKPVFYSIFIFVIVNVYILSCWLAWWNGGGNGMRYFVESYCLLSIPFGYFIQELSSRKLWLQSVIFSILIIFTLLNQFRIWQFTHYVWPHDRRNAAFFKEAFFATKRTPDLERLLDVERNFGIRDSLKNEADYTIRTIGYFNYENVNSVPVPSNVDTVHFLSPPNSLKLDPDHNYSPALKLRFNQITEKDHAFIRVSLDYYTEKPIQNNPATVVITMNYMGRNFYYSGFDLDKYPFKENQWNHVQFDYLTPYPFSVQNEYLNCYVWHRGSDPIYIDNFHIQALERKW